MISTCDGKGITIAKLSYSPFGEQLSSSTNASYLLPDASIPFTFSTKAVDASELSYYGFRFYNPEIGRWLSRDLIEENGGWNLYSFIENNALSKVDMKGLVGQPKDCCCCCAEDIKLSNIKSFYDSNMHYGNSYDINITVKYIDHETNRNDCKLKWEEKTNQPYDVDPGQTMIGGYWNDMFKIFTTSPSIIAANAAWNGRLMPCPGSEPVSFSDEPTEGIYNKDYKRFLFIRITVESGVGCPCEKPFARVNIEQILEVDKAGNKKEPIFRFTYE